MLMLACGRRFSAGVLPLIVVFAAKAQATKPSIQTPSAARQTEKNTDPAFAPALVDTGQSVFLQNCAFCHGRDAGGGETGPDLTRSKLVADDVNGDKIGVIVRNGRPDKGMPKFSLSDGDMAGVVAFVHTQKTLAESQVGGRRGVDIEDLQTGNVDAGKQYFNGAGGCASCHSVKGDLAGLAGRLQGLKLEQRMLYPHDAVPEVTVVQSDGTSLTGKMMYHDEFTVGLRDSSGWYHSWPVGQVKYNVKDPAEAHAQLLGKYTDDDIHNLMAYLQTLK